MAGASGEPRKRMSIGRLIYKGAKRPSGSVFIATFAGKCASGARSDSASKYAYTGVVAGLL